jgi:hypothetical protein
LFVNIYIVDGDPIMRGRWDPIVSIIAFNIFKFIGVSAKGFGYTQPLNI